MRWRRRKRREVLFPPTCCTPLPSRLKWPLGTRPCINYKPIYRPESCMAGARYTLLRQKPFSTTSSSSSSLSCIHIYEFSHDLGSKGIHNHHRGATGALSEVLLYSIRIFIRRRRMRREWWKWWRSIHIRCFPMGLCLCAVRNAIQTESRERERTLSVITWIIFHAQCILYTALRA